MARPPSKGKQVHPVGGTMSITDAQREDVRVRREAKGWRHEDLAARAGVSQGTISNVESGRTKQPRKVVYAAIMRALNAKDDSAPGADSKVFTEIVDALLVVDSATELAVHAFLMQLKARKK